LSEVSKPAGVRGRVCGSKGRGWDFQFLTNPYSQQRSGVFIRTNFFA